MTMKKPKPKPQAPAAETAPPPPAPRLDRLPIYYDGSRGPLQITLRDPSKALKFDGPGLRMVPTPDAQDLLAPAIGGGAFARAVLLADAASWTPPDFAEELAGLAAAAEVTVVHYQPAGASEAEPYLVLDARTRRRLNRKAA